MSQQGREWLESQPTENLMCRDTRYHHAWEPLRVSREGTRFSETMYCVRCNATKRTLLTASGLIVKQKLTYEPGYLRRGMGRATKADNAAYRSEHLRRRVEDPDA